VEIFGRVVSGCFSLFAAVVLLLGFAAFVSDRVTVHRFRRRFKGKHVLACTSADAFARFR
jgi:hypothetical protein